MRTSLLFVSVLLLASSLSAHAQSSSDTTEYVVLPVNVSFVRGVSIGDIVADHTGAKIVNRASFNILTGRSAALRGAEVSWVWGTYDEEVRGVQVAGVGNTVGESVRGVQVAGLLNIAGGSVEGGQVAGLLNIAGEELRGAQFAGLLSIAGERADMQVSGLMGIAGDRAGVQASGLISIAGEQADAQFSGLMSINGGNLRGVQASGLASITGDDIRGAQVSGFANISGGTVRGAQIAGVVNIAPRVDGLQLGVINVAGEHDGVPIGLVSYVQNVGLRYGVWSDETGMVTAAVRSGTERISNHLGVAARPFGDRFLWGFAAGLGVEQPLTRRAYAALDLLYYGLRGDVWDEWGNLSKARLLAGYRLGPRVALFGGPTFNVFVSDDADGSELAPWSVYDAEADGTHVRLWPGATIGVRLVPQRRAQRL